MYYNRNLDLEDKKSSNFENKWRLKAVESRKK